jgi:putative transposase
MVHKAYKFRAYPDEIQAIQMARTFGCVRFCWNLMLQGLKQNYNDTKDLSFPTPASYKQKHGFLKEVDSLALCNAQLNLGAALKRFLKEKDLNKKRKAGFPQWKTRKGSRKSYTTNCVNGNLRIEEGKLRLPKLGLLAVVFHRRVVGVIKSCTVTQDPSGKHFVSILTEQQDPVVPVIDTENIVGLDFSFHDLVVTSEGARLKCPRWFRDQRKRLARAQRSLARRTYGSGGYEQQRLKIARIHERIRNRRLDFLRKISKRILDTYDVVVVEDIDLSGMAKRGKRRKFGRVISDLGFGIFRDLLKQGAVFRGKVFVKADRWFPSSQLCSKCGYRNHGTKDLSVRTWDCPECHQHHDRDQNAGQNLVQWYRNNRSTGALPGIHAEGAVASTVGRKPNGKQPRRTRKRCGTIDLASPRL